VTAAAAGCGRGVTTGSAAGRRRGLGERVDVVQPPAQLPQQRALDLVQLGLDGRRAGQPPGQVGPRARGPAGEHARLRDERVGADRGRGRQAAVRIGRGVGLGHQVSFGGVT